MSDVDANVALLIDDEPEHLVWLSEYLESKGMRVEWAAHLPQALERLRTGRYRLLIVDMNIPDRGALETRFLSQVPLAQRYPGLAAIAEAKKAGYRAPSVIALTVHDDDSLDVELHKLGTRYVLKGRPHVLKQIIQQGLDGDARAAGT